ncbi:MAG: peptidoglycan-binding protein [Ilumatobacter sp.]
MSRPRPLAIIVALMLAACGSPSDDSTATREAGQAGSRGAAATPVESEIQDPTTTTVVPDPTSTAAATTNASTTTTTTTTTTSTTTTSTTPPTTAPPSTAPPTTSPPLARCVDGEINLFTEGRRGEIALYQTVLTELGYDPGEIDGFFGPNTYNAASQEVFDNGNLDGPNGVFEELFPDDGAVLPAAFERLGIACITDFTLDS